MEHYTYVNAWKEMDYFKFGPTQRPVWSLRTPELVPSVAPELLGAGGERGGRRAASLGKKTGQRPARLWPRFIRHDWGSRNLTAALPASTVSEPPSLGHRHYSTLHGTRIVCLVQHILINFITDYYITVSCISSL